MGGAGDGGVSKRRQYRNELPHSAKRQKQTCSLLKSLRFNYAICMLSPQPPQPLIFPQTIGQEAIICITDPIMTKIIPHPIGGLTRLFRLFDLILIKFSTFSI